MIQKKKLQRHKILREAYRHLSKFETLARQSEPEPSTGKYGKSGRVINGQSSGLKDIIEHDGIVLSYFDLVEVLKKTPLAPRKRQAFMLNVIEDKKQREVAEIMGITTVSVGQYVEQASLQLADAYFFDEDNDRLKIEDS